MRKKQLKKIKQIKIKQYIDNKETKIYYLKCKKDINKMKHNNSKKGNTLERMN